MAEIWRPVVGWKGFYEVSDRGRVRSVKRVVVRSNGRRHTVIARILQTPPNGDGYPHVNLHRPGRHVSAKVHILVARAFHGRCPNGLETRHLDGIRANCRATNLRYGTSEENGADKVNHGTSTRGEKNHHAVLTRKEVKKIRVARGTNVDVAGEYGVSPNTISDIRRGKSWSWL